MKRIHKGDDIQPKKKTAPLDKTFTPQPEKEGELKEKIPEETPLGEYTDGQIMSYQTMMITRDLGGFGPNRYRLNTRQNDRVIALLDPINIGGMALQLGEVTATPIPYVFNKHSRPQDNMVTNAILDLLDMDDATLLASVGTHALESIRDQLGDSPEATRAALMEHYELIGHLVEHDVFDEILPTLHIDANDSAELLFPFYTMHGHHWETGDIIIDRFYDPEADRYEYNITMTSHDPLGGGHIDEASSKQIATAIYRRIAEEHNKIFPPEQHVGIADFNFTSIESPYTEARQHDSISCGIITAHEMQRRIQGLDLDESFPANAITLRQQQITAMRNAYGADSQIFQSFMQGYAGMESKSAKPINPEGLSEKEMDEAITAHYLQELLQSEQRFHESSKTPEEPKLEEEVVTTAEPKSKKPLFQHRSAEIFSKEREDVAGYIELVNVPKQGKRYIHQADPLRQAFKEEKACIDNAIKKLDTWREQLTPARDNTARLLRESIDIKPGTLGQPKTMDKPGTAQELSTRLHNRILADKSDGWGLVSEKNAKDNKAFAATTTQVSVVKLEDKLRAIVAESGIKSLLPPYRRYGAQLSGLEPIDLTNVAIGPWKWADPSHAHAIKGKDLEEASPFGERISVISNIDSAKGNTRHAESNTIARVASWADEAVRKEQGVDYKTPINVEDVQAKMVEIMRKVATDKCHCAECGHASEQVFGAKFNSDTPREPRLFEHWKPPFPDFNMIFGDNPFRELNGTFKTNPKTGEAYKPGLIEGDTIPRLSADSLLKRSDSYTPQSPGLFYEDQEMGRLDSKGKGEEKPKFERPSKGEKEAYDLRAAFDVEEGLKLTLAWKDTPEIRGKEYPEALHLHFSEHDEEALHHLGEIMTEAHMMQDPSITHTVSPPHTPPQIGKGTTKGMDF